MPRWWQMSGGGPLSPDEGFFPPAWPSIAARLLETPRGGVGIPVEVGLDVILQQLFQGDGATAGGKLLGAWPGAFSPGMQFEFTATLLSTAPTTPITIIPDALIPAGKAVYINYIFVSVNGGTAWTTSYNVIIQDSAAVAGVTIATAQLTGNAIINSLAQSGVTASAAVIAQSGLTAGKGLQVVGSSASIVAGSPLIATVGGFIK